MVGPAQGRLSSSYGTKFREREQHQTYGEDLNRPKWEQGGRSGPRKQRGRRRGGRTLYTSRGNQVGLSFQQVLPVLGRQARLSPRSFCEIQVITECLLITTDRMGSGSSTGSPEQGGTGQQGETEGSRSGQLSGPASQGDGEPQKGEVSLFPQLWTLLKINDFGEAHWNI